MKSKKGIFLFLALLLPGCVFLFLKMFGRNEFAVAPLFHEPPVGIESATCSGLTFPYHLPDSALERLAMGSDSIALVVLGTPNKEGLNQLKRIDEEFSKDRIHRVSLPQDTKNFTAWRTCVFLLPPAFDVALVDRTGVIRGQYAVNDREEMDRLITELTIILKKY